MSSCYYPNGLSAPDDSPCDPSSSTGSPCCGGGLGGVCLSNGLCQGGNGNLVRGSCTDENWGEGCPLYCMSASTGGTDLISCSNVTNTDTSYCCDHTNGCCDSGVSRFTVLPASPTTVATWNPTLSRYVQLSTSTSSSSTSTTTGAQSETITSSSSTAISSSTSAAASASSSSSSSGLSTGAAAGIGVGGAVAAIAIAAAIFFLVRSHRKRRKPKGLELLGTTESKPPAAYGSPPVEAPDNVAPFRHEMGEPARVPPQELHGDSRMY